MSLETYENPGYEPVSVAAERLVLAGLLSHPGCMAEISAQLGTEDFAVRAHADIFRAIRSCWESGTPCTPVTVAAELEQSGALARLGGTAALFELAAMGGRVADVSAHADIVADRALSRRTLEAARRIAAAATAEGNSGAHAADEAEVAVLGLRRLAAEPTISMAESVRTTLSAIKAAAGGTLGHPTGFAAFDEATAGVQPGQLILIAARPSVGKSAFALQAAAHIAAHTGLAVPFLSHEMSHAELTMRLLAARLRCDLHLLRQGILTEEQRDLLPAAAAELSGSTLQLSEDPPDTVGGLRSMLLRRRTTAAPIAAVFIDYIQLMRGENPRSRDSRNTEVGEISRGLKQLAAKLGVPIIALSQLNRNAEGRPDKRPQLADLRDSGSLEQDASVVAFLHRQAMHDPRADPAGGELILAKQRNGPTLPSIAMRWHAPTASWHDASPTRAGAAHRLPPRSRDASEPVRII